MYFSQVRIKPNIQHSPQLTRLIKGNTYGIHQLLWDLFPEQKDRSFLYREETAREQLGDKKLCQRRTDFLSHIKRTACRR